MTPGVSREGERIGSRRVADQGSLGPGERPRPFAVVRRMRRGYDLSDLPGLPELPVLQDGDPRDRQLLPVRGHQVRYAARTRDAGFVAVQVVDKMQERDLDGVVRRVARLTAAGKFGDRRLYELEREVIGEPARGVIRWRAEPCRVHLP